MKNTKDKLFFDCVVVGSGPAGLTAAIYMLRANLSVALIENDTPGGKMTKTYTIDNYSGFHSIKGGNLSLKMFKQVKKLGGKFFFDSVIDVQLIKNNYREVILKLKKIKTYSIIIASGTVERKLGVPGENKYFSRGVSTCAVCDGALYKNKVVAVVGGGLSAIEEGLYLLKHAKNLFLIHRRQGFRAPDNIVLKLRKKSQVKFYLDYVVKEIIGGNNKVNALIIENVKNHKKEKINISCVFPYIGQIANTTFLKKINILDKFGFIIANQNDFSTKIPGIYAAGDVISKKLRQVSTAVGDGANAGQSAIGYIDNLKDN